MLSIMFRIGEVELTMEFGIKYFEYDLERVKSKEKVDYESQ